MEDFAIKYKKLSDKISENFQKELDNCQLSKNPYVTCDVYVNIPIDKYAPNTNGKVASKYVEIDGTRQLLWYWKNGKIVQRFPVSGAMHKDNPVGVYHIQNKVKYWPTVKQGLHSLKTGRY